MGPAAYLDVIVQISLVILAIYWICQSLINRQKRTRLLIYGGLALVLSGLLIFYYSILFIGKKMAAKQFAGCYKVTRIDRRECVSCEARLLPDYTYEIREAGSMVAKGKWDLVSPIDMPGYFLKVDHVPAYAIWTRTKIPCSTPETNNE